MKLPNTCVRIPLQMDTDKNCRIGPVSQGKSKIIFISYYIYVSFDPAKKLEFT